VLLLPEFAPEAHAFGNLKRRDDAPLDLLAGFAFHAHLPTQPRRRQSNHRGSSRLLLLRTTAQGAGFESSLAMANTAKIRSITVGIFDNAHDLEQAVAQLASAGFNGTAAYEAGIVAQEPGNVAPVGPVLAPSVVPAEAAGNVERDVPNTVSAFKSHLADYDLPDQMIEAYTTTFYHGGKFVLVRTHPQRDEQVVKILRQCGASRVNRYD
jgi:hypothetical protein